MFKLVGNETFDVVGQAKCQIQIRSKGLTYDYQLYVNGDVWKKFREHQEKSTKTWDATLLQDKHRIVLGELRRLP